MNELVKIINQKELVTESLTVAEYFKKEHKNVISSIKETITLGTVGRLNFQPSYYKNSQNKSQPMYYMDRDGFVLLAMSFTGKEAHQWKIKFIQAFNELEARLSICHDEEINALAKGNEKIQLYLFDLKVKLSKYSPKVKYGDISKRTGLPRTELRPANFLSRRRTPEEILKDKQRKAKFDDPNQMLLPFEDKVVSL